MRHSLDDSVDTGDDASSSAAARGSRKDFDWDEFKARTNEWKHGVSFSEAMSVFADPLSLTGFDPDHSVSEDRYVTMGVSDENRLLIVVHAESR